MTTASARSQPCMTVGEFLAWSAQRPDEERHELVHGLPVRLMAPTNLRHARIQRNASRLADVNDKVEFYSRIASIRHYLVIEQDQQRVVYHGRGPSGGLEPRILRGGNVVMEPPGISLALAELYRDTALGDAAQQPADQ